MRALKNNDVVVIRDLLPCPSEYIKKYGDQWLNKACAESEALKRAARTLAKRGLIKKVRYRVVLAPYKTKWVLAYSKCC